jgi:hypothetical protein
VNYIEVPLDNGEILEVPDGTTIEKIRELQARMSKRAQELTHTYAGPGSAASPPPDLSGEPLTFGQGFQAGRAGTDKEVSNILGGKVWKDPQGNLYWQKQGQDKWQPINQEGFGMGDLGRVLGGAYPETVGELLGALASLSPGVGLAGMAMRMGLGAGVGRALEEAWQMRQGTQEESLGDIAKKSATSGAISGGTTLIGGLMSPFLPGGGSMASQSKRGQEMLRNAIEFQAARPDYPELIPADILQETGRFGLPPSVVKSSVSQAENLSGKISATKTDAAVDAFAATQRHFPPPNQGQVVDDVTRMLEPINQQVNRDLAQIGPPSLEAGTAAREASRAANKRVKIGISRQYKGPLAEAIRTERPVFDLAPAQTPTAKPGLVRTEMIDSGFIDAQGKPVFAQVQSKLRGPDPAEKKIAFVQDFLRAVDPGQMDFEAIKQLRTMVGESVTFDPTSSGWKDHPGKVLYRQLTDVLKNPVNKDQTPNYLAEFGKANDLSAWWFDLRDRKSVRRLFDSEIGSANLVKEAANNPELLLTDGAQEVLRLAPERLREKFFGGVRREILSKPDTYDKLVALERGGNDNVINSLFRNKANFDVYKQSALRVQRFWASDVGQALQKVGDEGALFRQAIDGINSKEQADLLLSSATYGETKRYQQAIIGKMVDDAFMVRGDTQTIVSPATLQMKIQNLKKRGLWEILDPDQQKAMTGLRDYYLTTLAKKNDIGASLMTASVVANIKDITNPLGVQNFYNAVHDLATARMLAKYLTDPGRAKKFINQIGKAPRNKKVWGGTAGLAQPTVAAGAEEAWAWLTENDTEQ